MYEAADCEICGDAGYRVSLRADLTRLGVEKPAGRSWMYLCDAHVKQMNGLTWDVDRSIGQSLEDPRSPRRSSRSPRVA